MRFLLILLVAAPALMGFRTLGLLRDWLALRRWARRGCIASAYPAMTQPLPIAAGPAAAEREARRRLTASALAAAAVCCFAFAAGLGLAAALEWA